MNKFQKVSCIVLALAATVGAQTPAPTDKPKPCFSPGSEIPFTITLEGKYVSEITLGMVTIVTDSAAKPDQQAFVNSLGSTQQRPVGGVLQVVVKVPDYAVDGVYSLKTIRLWANGGTKEYQPPRDPKPSTICNTKRFEWPAVKSATQP
jgi:hypothetical protein